MRMNMFPLPTEIFVGIGHTFRVDVEFYIHVLQLYASHCQQKSVCVIDPIYHDNYPFTITAPFIFYT